MNKILTLLLAAVVAFGTLAGAFFAYQSYQLELIKSVKAESVSSTVQK
jgi:hypothetical protein